jgi:hypothetical protein
MKDFTMAFSSVRFPAEAGSRTHMTAEPKSPLEKPQSFKLTVYSDYI